MSNPIRLDDLLSGGQQSAAQSPAEGAIRLDDLLRPATPATPSVDAGALAANVRARAPGIPGFGSDVTAAPPRTAEERITASTPPLPVRVAQGVGQFGKELVTHPLPTIGHMIVDPFISAERTFLRPVQGERVTATQYLRGKSGPVPGSLAPGTIVTAENSPSSITPKEFRNAALQTTAVAATAPLGTVASKATEGGLMALLTGRTAGAVDEAAMKALARRVGHAAGVAPVGAAYSPEDPLTGAATLATLGPLLEPVAQRAGKVAAPLVRGARELGGRIREPLNPLGASGIAEAPRAPLTRPESPTAPVASLPGEQPTLRRRIAETIDPAISQRIREAEANPVTGLPGRAPFDRALPAVEANPALSVVRGDFNGTKALNDTKGHPYTDAEFRRVAAAMQQAAEELGVQPRNFHPPGGDEFLAIVPTEKAEAFTRRAAELYGVREHAPGVKSSISFGYGPTEVEADAAAYAAKARDKAAQGIPNRDQAPSAPAATGAVRTEPLDNIDVEPERFQFKQDVNRETGAGRALKGTDRFNPDLAGVVAVWRDPADGRLKIINGHHRYDLAKRAGVRELAVREIQAATPEQARSIGAMINIAEERGTPLDVAKLIRDTGMTRDEMAASGIPVGNALAEKGAALAKLDRTVFDRVAKGEIPEDVGVGVGNVLDRPEQQRAAVDLIQRSGKRLTRAEAENVARQVRDAGSESVTQETLFGTEETALSLAVDRARLAETLKKDLTRDSRLFGFVSREGRAEELGRAGNTINVEESARLAQESAGAAELFDRLASRAGPIGDILTQGARRLAHGERLAAVKSDIAPRLRAAVQEALAGGEGQGVAGSAADLGRDAPARGAATEEVADPTQAGLFAQEPAGAIRLDDLLGPADASVGGGGGARGDVVGGLTYRDVLAMSADELERHAALAREADRNIEASIFGAEGAKRYNAAQRTLNSTYADPNSERYKAAERTVAEMESQLTPAQQNRLFGIGQKGYNADELREIADAARDYSPDLAHEMDDTRLIATIGRELLTGHPEKNVVSAIRLRGAMAEARRRGATDQTLLDAVAEYAKAKGISEGQASELFRSTLDRLQSMAGGRGSRDVRPGTPLLTAGEGQPIALDDLLGEGQQPRLLEARDLFGNETAEGPAQGSMFSEQAGTAASRSLRETEAAARAEIPRLRTILAQTTDPAVRTQTAQRLAQLERLVNRGEKITPDELGTRAAAGESERMAAADRTPRVRGPEDEAPQLFEATTVPPTAPGTGGGAAPALTRPPALAPQVPTGLARYTDALRRLFSVATRTPESMSTALSIREHAARRALEDERALESLRTFAKRFDKLPDAERLDFIDRIETGQKQPTLELQGAADVMRRLLDEARDTIRALGTGKMEHFIEDYFPHIWEDPAKARQVIQRIESKRSLTGPGSFLKQRSIPTIKDGIAAGLTPLTTNPIDLVMLKLKEMHRYLMGQRIIEEMKSEGLARFVSSFEQPPEGYRAIDDKVGTVYGPPAVTMTETFDKLVVEKMQQIMKRLGIDHVRKPKIGGTRAGYYEMGGNKLVTRAGGTEQVIFHEFGHALDDRYGLWDRLIDPTNKSKAAIADRKVIQAELRALADLRFEGQQAEPAYQRYVRNRYEKIANAIAALIYAPEKMRAVAPTVMARLTDFLRERPEVADVLDVKPSLVLGSASHEIPVGGLVVTGRYYAPEPVATVLNNFLSPGLRGNPFFDAYMGLGNVMNQAQLGLSAFHLGFTSMDAAVSKAALGIEQLAAGRPVSGLVSLARTPIAPVENYLRGSKVLREYLRPGTQGGDLAAVVDALVKGGGRVRMDTFYKNSSVESFWKALSDTKRAYLQPVNPRSLGRAGTATVAIPWKGLGATLEVASKPILEHIVPRQKLGVFADLARFELSRLPQNASPELVRDVMARAWDSVDNRMGQLVYDNLFWHRALKDLSMASVRSVGWNLGTLREIGGGVLDVARVPARLFSGDRDALTHRMAYIAALPVVVGLAGAVMHYLYTGQAPETLKDYFYPRTGRKNADGTDERVQLPSYVKDIFAYAHHPYETVKHKIHPAVATIADMLENADFYGDQIRNPDDPLVRQIQQEADYLVQQFEPFGVSNIREELGRGQPLSRTLPNLVGVTPAPREAVRSPAVNRMGELLRHRMPTGATREQADERHRRSNLISRLRLEPEKGMAALRGSVAEGSLSGRRARNIARTALTPASVNSFKRLSVREALEVYEIASPEERRLWLPALADKLDRLDGALLTPAEVDDIMARIRRLSAAGAFGVPAPRTNPTAADVGDVVRLR